RSCSDTACATWTSRHSPRGGIRMPTSAARSRRSPTWVEAGASAFSASRTASPHSPTFSRGFGQSGSCHEEWRLMRALRFHTAGALRTEPVPEPGLPGPTEVTVAPRWCGICGTDLHEYLSGPIVTPSEPHALTGATLPQILGHEFSAEVVAVGSTVTRVKV